MEAGVASRVITVLLHKNGRRCSSFAQVMNLWERNDDICHFAFDKRLARAAADLMQVPQDRN